jgi:hypothetical protein
LIEKIVVKSVSEHKTDEPDLAYWLSRTPAERVEAVEILRKQFDGSSKGLQRTIRIIKRS